MDYKRLVKQYLNGFFTQLVQHQHVNKTFANEQIAQYIISIITVKSSSSISYSPGMYYIRSFHAYFQIYKINDFYIQRTTEHTLLNNITILYLLNGLKKSNLITILNQLNLHTPLLFNPKTRDLFISIIRSCFKENKISLNNIKEYATQLTDEFYRLIFKFQFENNIINSYDAFIHNKFDLNQLRLCLPYMRNTLSSLIQQINCNISTFTKTELRRLALINSALSHKLKINNDALMEILLNKEIKHDWQFLHSIINHISLTAHNRRIIQKHIDKSEANYIIRHM